MEFALGDLRGSEMAAKNALNRRSLHRRLGRTDHHEPRRGRADPAVEGKARRGRAGGLQRQPRRPARRRYRGAQPELGTSAIQVAPFPTSSAGSSIRSIASWRRPSTASSTTSTPCSRPSSCCPGRSPKRRRRKSTWPSSSTTCGSPTPAPPRSRSSPAAANGSK